MANPVLGKSMCSDWFFLGQDFAVHGNGPIRVFLFWSKAAHSKFATKTTKKKCENCHSSHWNCQQKLKRLNFFRNFKDGWRRRTFFKCKPREVHFTIRNRVPYNKLITNRASSGRTGEHWPSVVFVRTSLRLVRTVTTSGQYSPVRPSRSVSKRLIFRFHCFVTCNGLNTNIPSKSLMAGFSSLTLSASLSESAFPSSLYKIWEHKNHLLQLNIQHHTVIRLICNLIKRTSKNNRHGSSFPSCCLLQCSTCWL